MNPIVLSKPSFPLVFAIFGSHPCLLSPAFGALELGHSQLSSSPCRVPVTFLLFSGVWAKPLLTFLSFPEPRGRGLPASLEVSSSGKAVSITHPVAWLKSSVLPCHDCLNPLPRILLGTRGGSLDSLHSQTTTQSRPVSSFTPASCLPSPLPTDPWTPTAVRGSYDMAICSCHYSPGNKSPWPSILLGLCPKCFTWPLTRLFVVYRLGITPTL